MVEFKKYVEGQLPYHRMKYWAFTGWYGVSFQLNPKLRELNLKNYIEVYEPFFRSIIKELSDESFWIVNHDDKDLRWFPDNADTVNSFRTLFKLHNIPNAFKGALVFTEDEILKYSTDLVTYPFTVFAEEGLYYKDIDITHSKSGFIIHISSHMNIDFFSQDIEFLRGFVKTYSSEHFIIKPCDGTSI